MANIAKRDGNRPPTHPREILREDVLPALAITVSEAAEGLGISRQTLHRILAETCNDPSDSAQVMLLI